MPRERDVLGARDVLVAEEHDLVLEQQRADFGDELGVARGGAQVHVGELRADRARQRLDLDGAARGDVRGGGCSRHVCRSWIESADQIAKIDEPVVLRASRSRCACAASFSSIALVDLDLDPARRDVPEQLAGELALLRRIRDVVGERRPRDEDRALERELHRIDRRDRARRRAHAHQQAAPFQRVERGGKRVLADAVVDDRRADAVGQLANALRDVLAASS